MKKIALIAFIALVSSCTTKTVTITDHILTIADSSRILTFSEKASKVNIATYLIAAQLQKIRSGKLDSVQLNAACDSIAVGGNVFLQAIKPLKDTVYK